MPASDPFYAGFLLPDGTHAVYVADECAFLLAVVPDLYGGLYAQRGEAALVAVDIDDSEESVVILYRRLNEVTAYELLTQRYDTKYEAYLV
jgi:hypothetical protein